MEHPDWEGLRRQWAEEDERAARRRARRRRIEATPRAELIQVALNGSYPFGTRRSHPCRWWQGTRDRDGYALWRGMRLARLLALSVYEFHSPYDEIDIDGTTWTVRQLMADHMCHNEALAVGFCRPGRCWHRGCVEPTHLTLVTPTENARRLLQPYYAGEEMVFHESVEDEGFNDWLSAAD